MGDHELPGWVNGVGGETEGDTVKAMPGREGRVGFPRADGIEGEFNLGEKIRPAGGGERDVTSG